MSKKLAVAQFRRELRLAPDRARVGAAHARHCSIWKSIHLELACDARRLRLGILAYPWTGRCVECGDECVGRGQQRLQPCTAQHE